MKKFTHAVKFLQIARSRLVFFLYFKIKIAKKQIVPISESSRNPIVDKNDAYKSKNEVNFF